MPKKTQGGPAADVVTTTSEVKAHAPFGASKAKRWLSCPGSVALCEQAPEQPESPYAREGTEAHACLEFLLRNRADLGRARREALAMMTEPVYASVADDLGPPKFVEEPRRRWTKDMVDHASQAVAYILTRLSEHRAADLLIETRVDASPFTAPDQFGTLDVAIVEHFRRLVVMDYKYGAGVAVEPATDGKANEQLAYYALALSYVYDHNFDEVELVVIQPRAYHSSGETIRSHVMTIDELEDWHQVFRAGVRAAAKVDAPLAPGEWCRWCEAKVICPKLKGDGFEKTGTALQERTGVVSLPAPKMVPLENLGRVLEGCERLEEWIGAVRAHAYGLLERGAPVPGWKLVDKRASRKWKDVDAAAEHLEAQFEGMKNECIFDPPSLKSVAQVEAALIASGMGKPDVRKLLEPLIEMKSSGRTMVKATDNRGAVAGRSDPKSVFSAIRPE